MEDTILKTTTLLSGGRFDQVNIVLTRSIFPEDDVVGSKLAISKPPSKRETIEREEEGAQKEKRREEEKRQQACVRRMKDSQVFSH